MNERLQKEMDIATTKQVYESIIHSFSNKGIIVIVDKLEEYLKEYQKIER